MRRFGSPGHVSAIVALAFLLPTFAVPLATIVLHGLAGTTSEGLARTLSQPYVWTTLLRTAAQAAVSTLATLFVGLPAALAFARWSFPGKAWLRATTLVPFVMPSVVAGIGFLAWLGPRGLAGLDATDTLALLVAVHVFYNQAVVVRIVGGFLEASAPRLRDAASTLGASETTIAWRVTLPLAAPAIAAAASLVFLFCFTSFGVVLIVAPSGGWDTLEVEIYRVVRRLMRLDVAATLAAVQLIVALAVSSAYVRAQERSSLPVAAPLPLPRPGPRGRWVLAATLVLPIALTTLPLAALIVRSVVAPDGTVSGAAGWLAAFAPARLLGVTTGWDAARNSIAFAATSATMASIVGFAFAYAVHRGGYRWLDRASLVPLATSAVTLGLGLLVTFPVLAGTFWGLALAHATIGVPFVARSVLPSLRAIPRSRTDAAATLGAGPWRRLLRVDVPASAAGLVTGTGFAAAVSLGEFGASAVLTRPDLATLPVAIFQRLSRPGLENYQAALALAATLMVVTAVCMVALDRLGGRSEW